ncbi:hypothetical protein EVAR_42864_1 [Eumeta japonica]|uniref:Uncharacterized protein n=1 Tax=Eumeta variegata TaxID=151549 RepID=A0A4C1ZSL2_EUMVA|nr:hypothetical protein EVAR_42864_1 [Eumeta japonica]
MYTGAGGTKVQCLNRNTSNKNPDHGRIDKGGFCRSLKSIKRAHVPCLGAGDIEAEFRASPLRWPQSSLSSLDSYDHRGALKARAS